ncbi:hypothetical protein [uncultured Marixanthomonas sp.]|uniref:hypothetical protein n=1 Tax=uncultured Marixanthomonas sp. TaxID=757245 RepID=UPI0030DBB2CE|tara:strand:- start:130037 stop:130705 length:669 start_codon:yes stop_codon:yes gene_type:complete
MKGKDQFSKVEAKAIEQLITKKLLADATQQKNIRAKIRGFGFYASDFALGGGYTVQDFRTVVTIGVKNFEPKRKALKTVGSETTQLKTVIKKQSDEAYIIGLCDEVLKVKGLRQYRFEFLRGDTGVKLPVDVYYPSLNLVIEYYERQHTEQVNFFDKRITSTGITRGEQRKKYDQLRKTELPKHSIKLIVLDYSNFQHTRNKRLVRCKKEDLEVVNLKLKEI